MTAPSGVPFARQASPPPADALKARGVLEEMRAESRRALRRQVRHTIARACAPPPRLTVSEWADAERMLSPESSSEPGKWSTSRVEPARGVMDAFSDPRVEKVTAMVCTQVLKTEALNNVVAYHVCQDPAPMMVLQPTIAMAESWSKDRLTPMLRDTPALKGKIGDPRSRDSENTILHKTFTGGHITMAGANSPASLASRPIRVVLCDEVDRYPLSAGKEGDPVSLVVERTSTFWNRKIGLFSTPTIKGISRIEASFLESDQRRYFVPCPHCGEADHLRWANVRWPEGKPEEAAYHCGACGAAWSEGQRLRAIRAGRWRQTAEFECCGEKRTPRRWDAEGRSLCDCCGHPSPFKGHAGFHLNKLASPWTTVPKIVAQFLEAKRFPDKLKVWVNTTLAETWEDEGEGLEAGGLFARREDYEAEPLPPGVLLLTAGVDIQDDRAEIEVLGHGLDDETWSIDYLRLYGDPTSRQFWDAVDEVLLRRYRHPSGRALGIEATSVDSGAHTQAVYDFCRPRAGRRVWAIKGDEGPRPIWPEKATKNAAKKINVFIVGVDTAKDLVYRRLTIDTPGPGYCHFPTRYGESYFEGLTVERQVTKYRNGFPYKAWRKENGDRNEPLDCRVYAIAARLSLKVDMGRRAALLGVAAARKPPPPPPRPAPAAAGGDAAEAPPAPPAPALAANRATAPPRVARPRIRSRGVPA